MPRPPIKWRPRAREHHGATIVHLKMVVADTNPAIWRSVAVPGRIGLDRLHRVIQCCLDWSNSHLHYFQFGQLRFADPDQDDPDTDAVDRLGASYQGISLDQFTLGAGDRFEYVYDLGDEWHHEIAVEAVEEATVEAKPRCRGGERASPPEDCGGAPGYAVILEWLDQPGDRENEHLREFIPRGFRPERFDIGRVNRRLARLR